MSLPNDGGVPSEGPGNMTSHKDIVDNCALLTLW